MEFTEEQKSLFLNDIPFFENGKCFCLGDSLEEAGEIVRLIIAEKGVELCGSGA